MTDSTQAAPFGEAYASAYDVLYREKDYARECDAVEALFTRHARRPIRRVLDLGCGTGGHAVELAGRGYEVSGVDASASMIARARQKAQGLPPGRRPRFSTGRAEALALEERFDAVLMLFAVLGYMVETERVLAALGSCCRHLHEGGLLVFDAWYGPAVLCQRPAERFRCIEAEGRTVIRLVRPELDVLHHRCTVEYELWSVADGRVVDRARERHVMRFFFPLEVELLLRSAGLEPAGLTAFPDVERPPAEDTWSFAAAARAPSPGACGP